MQKSLKSYQDIFWKFIAAPEGVEKAVKAFPKIQLEDLFLGDEKLPATKRLDIYANMYFWRIHDAIKEDYPRIVKVIGDAKWNDLMTDYLLEYPSDTPLLQYAGKHLPKFLKGHPFSKEWPNLPGLAILEWERTMMFEAPDSSYISIADLQKVPAAKWPQLKLQLIPAFKIVELETSIRIWKKDFIVYDKELDNGEKECLELIQAGHPFEIMCERLQSSEIAAQFLADWIESGLIKTYVVEKP